MDLEMVHNVYIGDMSLLQNVSQHVVDGDDGEIELW